MADKPFWADADTGNPPPGVANWEKAKAKKPAKKKASTKAKK